MKKKILDVYRTYFPDPPGGVAEAIRQICKSTSLFTQHKVFTLSPNNKNKIIEFSEAEVIRSKSWVAPASCDLGSLDAFLTFSDLVKNSDIIQYHFPWPFADLLHWYAKPNIPTVTIYHSDIVRQRLLNSLYAPLMWKTLQSMDAIIATSPTYAETSPVLCHPDVRNKVRVIPLGIDESSYDFNFDDTIFNRINIRKTEPYFLFLGVLRYYKGVHTLISAAKKVKTNIVIAGHGPEASRLQIQVKELGLKNIIFAGLVSHSEKVSLIKNCLSLVLPSHLRSEAFGVVLIEAAMMQKPMISCEIGTGTSYVNINGLTGFVVPPESSDYLANAMNSMLKSEFEVVKMGLSARMRYEQLFSGQVLGKAYSSLYEDLL